MENDTAVDKTAETQEETILLTIDRVCYMIVT